MKKFAFTLQTVMDMTLSTEKQQKIQLRQLEEALRQLRIELERMKSDYLTAKERCAEEMQKGLSSEKLAQYNVYFESLIHAMIVQKDRILCREREREEMMNALVETRKELKTLEKLRDQQYEAYQVEVRMEEEKEIGDTVSFQVASR